jgi:hypothetical protein
LAGNVSRIKIPPDLIANTEGLMEAVQATETALRGVVKAFAGAEDIRATVGDLSTKFRSGTKEIQNELELFADRIRQIKVPADVIANTEGLTAAVRGLEAAFRKLLQELESSATSPPGRGDRRDSSGQRTESGRDSRGSDGAPKTFIHRLLVVIGFRR